MLTASFHKLKLMQATMDKLLLRLNMCIRSIKTWNGGGGLLSRVTDSRSDQIRHFSNEVNHNNKTKSNSDTLKY